MTRILILGAVLLLAVPASAQEPEHHEGWLHAAIAGAMVAHGADLSTTSWAMGKSGNKYVESNPLLKPFAGDPVALAAAKMGTAVALNYALLRMHKRHPKITAALAVGQIIGIGYVAHRNAQLLGLRGR